MRGHSVRAQPGELAEFGSSLEIVDPPELRLALADIARQLTPTDPRSSPTRPRSSRRHRPPPVPRHESVDGPGVVGDGHDLLEGSTPVPRLRRELGLDGLVPRLRNLGDHAAMSEPFDLTTTPAHLGLGATTVPLHGFSWDASSLEEYERRTGSDGNEGRLVTMFSLTDPWPHWEMHPNGSELVVCLSGRSGLIQQRDGETLTVELAPGQAIVNPPGTWHIAEPHETTTMLFITAGRGTVHRPR